MTDHLFYASPGALTAAGSEVTLDADTSRHAISSMRLGKGGTLLVADGEGWIGSATVLNPDSRQAVVRIDDLHQEPQPDLEINLVQALAKGDRDLMAVQMATEIGVDAVTAWQAERSIVRIRPERAAKLQAKWAATVKTAAQQARRARIPYLHDPVTGTGIADLHDPATGKIVVVLHEDGTQTLESGLQSFSQAQQLNIVVGPEGGVTDAELEAARQAGASVVRIGRNVMRSSTAGPVAISLLQQMLGRW